MKTKLLTMLAVLLPLFSTSLKAQEPTTYYWYVGQENPVGIDTDNLKAATNEAGWHLIGESIDGFTLTFNNDNLIEFEEDKPYYLVIPEGLDVLAADGNALLEYKTFFPVDCNIANHKAYVYYTSVWEVKGLVLKSGVTKYYWYVGQEDPANNQTVTYTTGGEGWRLIQQPNSVTKNNPLFDTIDSDEETIVGTKFANWYIAFPVDKSYRIFDSDHEDQITVGNFYIYSYVTFNDVEYVVYKGFGTARKWWGYTIYGGEVAQYYYWYAGQEHPSQVSTIVTDKSSTGWRMTGSSLTSHYGFDTTLNPIASNPSQNARWYFALPANTGLGVFDAIHNNYAVDENTADKWTEYAGTCTFQGVEYIVYCTGESRSFNAHYVRPKDFVPELTLDGIKYHADAASLTASVEGVEEGFSQVDVEIPAKVDYCYSTVTNINTHAFSNNTVISSILLPSTVTRIARLAFVRCSNLTSITFLGQTPPEVDAEAFSDFHYEQITLNVPEGAEEAYKQHEVWGKFFKEEEPAEPEPYVTEFEANGIHYIFLEKYVSNDKLAAWVTSTNGWFPGEENTYSGDIVIPATVTYGGKEYSVMGICENAFKKCSINSLTLSEGVVYISPNIFEETHLGALYLPSTFRMWDNFFTNEVNGYMLLQGCLGLETLVVSPEHPLYDSRDNCNAIIETATNTLIEGCKGTVIPSSVTTIGPTAFMGRDIVEFVIPEGVKEVKGRVFERCKNLQSVVFPISVEVIKGNMLFHGCSSLTSVEIPQTTLIRSAEDYEDPFETPGAMVIPSYMFSECSSLKEFAIPENVTSIGSAAFFMCGNLEAITIPESVVAIGDLAFYDCNKMTEITFWGQTPPAVPVDAFNETQYEQITLNVLEGAEDAYKQHEVWGKFFKEEEPEATPEPASVAFTFTRDADVAVNVEGIEGVTASIEAAPAAYLTTAAAANDSILCINQNTSTATADNPNKYTLTITNNSGVDLAFDYINVCGVALTSTGNFQGVRTVRDRVFVVSYGDNTLAPATMRICDDSHCSGVATVNTFEAVDAIPASSTYVIGVSIYTDGGAGCFYGLTRITLGKNEPEGGDVTNIESPVLEAQDSQLIYDLQGRRVTHPTKGIYIVGGKKVIMK